MPVEWSSGLDLCDQIWLQVGLPFIFLILQLLEMREAKTTTVSFNKVRVSSHLLLSWCPVVESLLAGLGSEGKRRIHGSTRASSRWQGATLLHLGVSSMADKLAAVIFGRRSGPSRRRVGVSSTSDGDALYGDSRRTLSSSCNQVVRLRRHSEDRRWDLSFGGETLGLDCIFCCSFRVFCVYFQDCFALYLFLGPKCNMYPPTV